MTILSGCSDLTEDPLGFDKLRFDQTRERLRGLMVMGEELSHVALRLFVTADDPQKTCGGDFNDDEKRQRELDRRAWQRFLDRVDDDISREPERNVDFYRVASHRLEPIGIAYL
jgi:hypothetical protein